MNTNINEPSPFRLAADTIVPHAGQYHGRTIDQVALTDHGLRWLHDMHKAPNRHQKKNDSQFRAHLALYLSDKVIARDLRKLGCVR